ncbi:hypothetical protein TIFTF001_002427 [Ficus carica]|uniref:Uncharacterized protein n=1 Tax=Ficus carica TaxID=3494 RepID=A0AA87ZMM3_FICCA|nr:hypothetical protein TIFTF001_002427 [Ficus carica]
MSITRPYAVLGEHEKPIRSYRLTRVTAYRARLCSEHPTSGNVPRIDRSPPGPHSYLTSHKSCHCTRQLQAPPTYCHLQALPTYCCSTSRCHPPPPTLTGAVLQAPAGATLLSPVSSQRHVAPVHWTESTCKHKTYSPLGCPR